MEPTTITTGTTTDTTVTGSETTGVDQQAAEAFGQEVFGHYVGGMLTYMIDLGIRTGLLDALAEGPATSHELAERAGAVERYVREWLAALATGGIVRYDPATQTFELPPEHAVCLTGTSAFNVAPQSRITTLLARYVDGVADAFRDGGGIPFTAYRPEFTGVMDQLSRGIMDDALIDRILPLTGELPDRLERGIRVADVGCGTGHAANLLARHFPASTFVGYDIAPDAIDRAREEAAAWGLTNATFEVLDATRLPVDPPFDAVFAFDTVHDLVDPRGVLARIHDALTPGGTLVVYDVNASSDLADNLAHPLAPFIYAVSTLHCLTVSLSEDGAGLGTAWGRQQAMLLLADAGFEGVTVHDVPDDPLNCVYVGHRPTGDR